MKKMQYLILSLAVIFMLAQANMLAGEKKDIRKVEIKTSAQCDMCKDRIEKALNKLDGVDKAILDLKTKKVEVTYDSKEISVDKIKKSISKTGYDAENLAADKKAYDKLPKCCKKPAGE